MPSEQAEETVELDLNDPALDVGGDGGADAGGDDAAAADGARAAAGDAAGGGDKEAEAAAAAKAAADGASGAPAKAAALPEWSKPLQQVQQTIANMGRRLDEALLALSQRPGTAAAVAAIETQKDELAEMEAKLDATLGDPKFDNLENGTAVFRQLLQLHKATRQRALAAEKRLSEIDDAKKSLAEVRQETLQAREQARHTAYWSDFADAHPTLGAKGGRALWNEVAAAVGEDQSLATDAERLGAAKALFSMRVKAAEAAGGGGAAAGSGAAAAGPGAGGKGKANSGGQMGLPGAGAAGRSGAALPPVKDLDDRLAAGEYDLSGALG